MAQLLTVFGELKTGPHLLELNFISGVNQRLVARLRDLEDLTI